MGKIISVSLQKGGVGKTTTCVNIAACLALMGKRVLLIDFDPQGNATLNFGVDPDKLEKTVYTVITGESELKDSIITTPYAVDLLPANDDLSELDMVILNNRDIFSNPAYVLMDAIAPITNSYDYILIDLPPSKGLLTINALAASTDVIIPMQCEYLATSGVNKIMDTIDKVRKAYNPRLYLLGIVATMFNVRTNLSSVVLQEARKHFAQRGVKVFDTTIYRSVKFAEAPMAGQPAVLYQPDNENIQAYKELTKEVFGIE